MNLTTERLRLRPLEPGDLEALATLYADPEVMRFSLGLMDREKTRERLEIHMRLAAERDLGAHAVETLDDGRFAGIVGLQAQTIDEVNEIELGYRLMPEFWGRGIASEAARACLAFAFETLELPRVISIIESENVASIRVAEKTGMTLEKETRKWDRHVRIYSVVRPTS